MLIKSGATGEMVELREAMKVCFHPSEAFTVVKICGTTIELVGDDGCKTETHLPELLTMLHAPFVVGDEAEILDVSTGKWHYTAIDDEDLNMATRHGSIFGDWLSKFRHANPSLRDSEDYKP